MSTLYIRPDNLRAGDVVSITEDGTQPNDMRSMLKLTRYELCAPITPDVHMWIAQNVQTCEQKIVKLDYYAKVVGGRAFADMQARRGASSAHELFRSVYQGGGMMDKFIVDQAVQTAIKPFAETLKRFDDNTEDIGLFEWLNRYADEELVYDSLVSLVASPATAQTERDAEAFAEFEAGGGDIWTCLADRAVELGKSIVALKAKHKSELASLQAERDQLASQLVAAGAKNERLREEMQEALACLRTSLAPINLPYPSQQAFLDEMRNQAARVLDKALQSNPQPAPAANSELVAAVTIEEMSSTLLPDGHEVKGLGCFIEHDGQKLLFFESSVVSDLQHDLSVAKDRIAVLEQSEQMLLKRIKKLRSKSELDDGFIDHLLANNEDSQ